jgi:basic membrane protein A
MKRIALAFALLAALASTGCSGPKQSASESPSSTVSESVTVSMPSASSADTALPKPLKDVKAGFIYIGPADDNGFSMSHDVGRQYLEKQLGIETTYKENIPEGDELQKTIDMLISEGCNVIIGCSYGYMDDFELKAAEYPAIYFLHCSGDKSNGVNFINYFGRIYEARYLSGIAAGLTTKSNKIGYVAAFPLPEVNRGIDAFALGVQAINPDATVKIAWTNNWTDTNGAREDAIALIGEGCDVIAQHVDSTSPQTAAEEAGIYCVGYHSNSITVAPNASIASAVWNWGPYYVAVIQSIMDGTWTGENYWGGMEEDVVRLELTDNTPEAALQPIQAAKTQILGGWDPFTGPIFDNEGNVIAADGVSLTDDELRSIMWLNSNVIGTVQ